MGSFLPPIPYNGDMKWIAIAVAVSLTAAAWCCCGVSFDGKGVVFQGQANVIIWDADTKTQHFIRQARFATDADDIGFIAPTPTVPDLGTVDPAIYVALASLRPRPASIGCSADRGPSLSATASDGVDVVQVKDVGAYRATTLRASDAQALAKWMRANNYVTSKSIEEWTAFYIGKDWFLTAFKIRAGAADEAKTIPVRMSFKAERPFNPYFVPDDNIDENKGGGLLLYFVSNGSYRNEVPNTDHKLNARWRERLTNDALRDLKAGLGIEIKGLSEGWEVAHYTDYEFPRRTSDDLYFTYAGASDWVWTPARIAIDVAFIAVVVGGVVWWRRRRA